MEKTLPQKTHRLPTRTAQLQEELQELGLPTTGSTEEMERRLLESEEQLSEEANELLRLPKDALWSILLETPVVTINRFCRTSEKFRGICQDLKFWTEYLRSNPQEAYGVLRHALSNENLELLNIGLRYYSSLSPPEIQKLVGRASSTKDPLLLQAILQKVIENQGTVRLTPLTIAGFVDRPKADELFRTIVRYLKSIEGGSHEGAGLTRTFLKYKGLKATQTWLDSVSEEDADLFFLFLVGVLKQLLIEADSSWEILWDKYDELLSEAQRQTLIRALKGINPYPLPLPVSEKFGVVPPANTLYDFLVHAVNYENLELFKEIVEKYRPAESEVIAIVRENDSTSDKRFHKYLGISESP